MTGYALNAAGNAFRAVAGPEDCINGEVFFINVPTLVPTAPDIVAKSLEVQTKQDILDAKNYTKLQALSTMSPTQIQSWVQADVNTLADAKDALKTLAVAVGILARRL
jgi:hypothetical protein